MLFRSIAFFKSVDSKTCELQKILRILICLVLYSRYNYGGPLRGVNTLKIQKSLFFGFLFFKFFAVCEKVEIVMPNKERNL